MREYGAVTATVPVSRYRLAGDGPTAPAVAASPSVELVENPARTRYPLSTLSTTRRLLGPFTR